jgi:ubiquinone/menaquinone biosynthesis C-methylase UbiE
MSDQVQRWKTLDAASYDDVAEQFDEFSNRLSTMAARRVLELARVGTGDRVLDVGTGAGLLPFELLQAGTAVGPVVGIDISTGMIAAARAKAQRAGLPESRLRFEQMDAESLAFEDASFDVVLSAFALTHVPHPDVALRECLRVLRPGGRIVIALGSRPALFSLDTVTHGVRELRRRLAARRGRRLSADLLDRIIIERYGPAPSDLPQGSALATQLNRSELLVSLVEDAGFIDVQRSWRNYQNQIGTPEEFWNLHRTIRSDARKRLLSAPPEMLDDVRARFLEACHETLARGGIMAFPISAVFVSARKVDAPKSAAHTQ